MARQTAKPRLLAVQGLLFDHKPLALDHLLHPANSPHGLLHIGMGNRDGAGHQAERHQILTKLLQSRIGIGGLVGGITVKQCRSLLGRLLFQHGEQVLSL